MDTASHSFIRRRISSHANTTAGWNTSWTVGNPVSCNYGIQKLIRITTQLSKNQEPEPHKLITPPHCMTISIFCTFDTAESTWDNQSQVSNVCQCNFLKGVHVQCQFFIEILMESYLTVYTHHRDPSGCIGLCTSNHTTSASTDTHSSHSITPEHHP